MTLAGDGFSCIFACKFESSVVRASGDLVSLASPSVVFDLIVVVLDELEFCAEDCTDVEESVDEVPPEVVPDEPEELPPDVPTDSRTEVLVAESASTAGLSL